jgi:hypothetical protein
MRFNEIRKRWLGRLARASGVSNGPSAKTGALTQPPRRTSRRATVRLGLEQLGDRTLPSNFTAATVSDLIADINAANKAHDANTITLTAPTTSPYVLTAVDNTTDGATGLPVITNNDNLTIVGNGDTIERSTASGMPDFRLFVVDKGGSLTLQNLTLQNGLEDGSGASAEGGAIYSQGTLVLTAATVQLNTAQGSAGKNNGGDGSDAAGGAIWSNGTLTLQSGTLVQSNQAIGGAGGPGDPSGGFGRAPIGGVGGNGLGGGVYLAGGTANLINATLSSNTAEGGQGGGNGPINTEGGNGGNAYGGSLDVAAGTVTLTGATVNNNQTLGGLGGVPSPGNGVGGNGGNAYGGALYVASGTVTLSSDFVETNQALGGNATGGAFNSGNGYGGGLSVAAGTVTLCNDTLEFNKAVGGIGAVFPGQGFGGGIYIESGATVYIDAFTVANTINNTDSSGTNGSTANIDGTYILMNC